MNFRIMCYFVWLGVIIYVLFFFVFLGFYYIFGIGGLVGFVSLYVYGWSDEIEREFFVFEIKIKG